MYTRRGTTGTTNGAASETHDVLPHHEHLLPGRDRPSDASPTANGPAYAVVVSDHGHTVSVGATPFVGSQTAASAERVEFALAQGTFAGGRFVVWPGVETLEAELTLYGSGRPIVQSERGKLVPAP